MKLKYVGARPVVRKSGVSFDQTKPDKYTFISTAMEILSAFEELRVDENGVLDLSDVNRASYSDKNLVENALSFCRDLEKLSQESEKKTKEIISEYEKDISKSSNLNNDEKKAWLGNISIMKDYYLQYVANELVYKCILDLIADKTVSGHVREIRFPLQRDYGLVLSHLIPVLTDHRPPMDATLSVEEKNGITYGKFDTHRKKPTIN